MRRRRRQTVKFTLRLHSEQDDDLIQWLESLDDLHFGAKTQAVKDALRRGIGDPGHQASAPTTTVDLAEIRAVVEAAVTQALARFEGQVAGAAVVAPEEDEETETLLDSLEAALVLAEDD